MAEKEGRTSVFAIPKVLVTTSLSVPRVAEIVGLMRKSMETTPSTKGKKVGLAMKYADVCGKVEAVLKKCFSIVEK